MGAQDGLSEDEWEVDEGCEDWSLSELAFVMEWEGVPGSSSSKSSVSNDQEINSVFPHCAIPWDKEGSGHSRMYVTEKNISVCEMSAGSASTKRKSSDSTIFEFAAALADLNGGLDRPDLMNPFGSDSLDWKNNSDRRPGCFAEDTTTSDSLHTAAQLLRT